MSEAAETEEEFDVLVEGEDEAEIVDVVDTTPDKDKGKSLLPPEEEDLEEITEDEVKTYSERVQKRIKDATFRFHDQRRKREAAERQAEEAIKFAQEQLKKAKELEAAVYQYEAGFVDHGKARVEAELTQARADMKAAFDAGDADKMAEAQAKIAKLAVQEEQYSRFRPREVAAEETEYRPATQPQPSDDDAERFVKWRNENKWFDEDDTLRDFAMGLHARIASNTPEIVGSDDYYAEITRKVKSTFPTKFQSEARPRSEARTPVAGVSRASGAEKTRKTVTLTREQMNLCRKLGITPQQYVRELSKNGD